MPNISYELEGEGRVNTVNASSGQNPLVTSTTYSPGYGLPTQVNLGSGDSDAFDYDIMGRMTTFQYNVGSQSIAGNLTWNPNGTLANLAINDPFNPSDTQTCGYGYDDLARIAAAECVGNPLSNPGFESGNTGWTLNTGFSIVDNPANAQSGNWYLSGSSATETNAVASDTSGSLWIPVTPGQTITFGGWIERVGGTGVLDWGCVIYDVNHNWVAWCPAVGSGDGSGGTDWQFYSGEVTVPSNGAYMQFFAEIHGWGDTDASLTSGYFDGAFFEVSSGAGAGSVWSQAFTYDPFGNITKTAAVGTSFQPTYNTATNRVTQVGNFTPTYDADGNLTSDPVHSYTWDSDGNVLSIPSDGISLTYDALDRMVEQNNNQGYTQIVYGPDGSKLALMNGQTLSKAFVPLAAGATAVYNANGLAWYRHPDWLGSSRFASLPTGSNRLYYDGAYAPFGENYAEMGTQDRNFTGQNQDTVSSGPYPLYDFLHREYHPVWGRWLNPDPAGLAAVDPSNPQSWNRYAYVRNNPLALVDPYGYDCAYLKQGAIDIDHVDTNTNFVDCTKNGGYWVSGQVNEVTLTSSGDLQFGYSGWGANGAFQNITYNSYLGPNTDNSWLSAAGAAGLLLSDFVTGTPPAYRYYDMTTVETRSLMQSKGVQQLNQDIQAQCQRGKTSGRGNVGTMQAALNIPYDLANSPTGFQVGGYNSTWQTVGPGVVSVTITNPASLHSLAYHQAPSHEQSQFGRFGTIHQKFQFNEPMSCGQ